MTQEVPRKKVPTLLLKGSSHPAWIAPSFTEEGTGYRLKSSGLGVAATTLLLLRAHVTGKYHKNIFRTRNENQLLHIFVSTRIMQTLFILRHTVPPLAIMNTPAESKHIRDTSINPQA